jgi:uncharacterized protein (TIGR03086 family)
VEPELLLAWSAGWVHDLLGALEPEDLSAATPCAAWDVAALVSHLVEGNRSMASAVAWGAPVPLPVEPGADPSGAYRAATQALVDAFAEPGALRRYVTADGEDVLVEVVQLVAISEQLLHGWDLARALGSSSSPAPEVVAAALQVLPPLAAARAGLGYYAAPVEVAETAADMDRLAALFGRQP